MPAYMDIQLISIVVAVACALPGTFLVLRKMAMISDAISHAILPGIVIAFFITERLDSPLLFVGAVVMGLSTAALIEALTKTRLLKEDAAIGIVFPALFSIGVILVSKFAGNVHLDTDAVLLGEIAFAPFDRFILAGVDIGPRSLITMTGVLLLNLTLILIFYKELKLATFDPGLAAALGFAPGLIHYGLMALVSITTVGAFDSVGSILVVALMIAPPAAAFLFTEKLSSMIALGAFFGALSAILGNTVARILDVSISGSIACAAGILFLMAFLFAPRRGLLSQKVNRRKQRIDFGIQMLSVHLAQHTCRLGLGDPAIECSRNHLVEHINWSKEFAAAVVLAGKRRRLLLEKDGSLQLTETGQLLAIEAMEN